MIAISYRLLNALKQDRPIERLCEVCDSPGLQKPVREALCSGTR
jgi:hypothetical protein